MPKKGRETKEQNQYLDVSAACRATVSVKLLVMSSHRGSELNPQSTGRGQKWPTRLRPSIQMNPVTKKAEMFFFLLGFTELRH